MTRSEIALSATANADLKRQALGIGLVVFSTIAIAIVPTLAKLAYEGGSNTLSVITGRSIFSVFITLFLLMFCVSQSRSGGGRCELLFAQALAMP